MVDDDLSDDDFENVAGGEPLPWLPPDQYPARLVRSRKKMYLGWGEKKIFHWQVYISPDLKQHVELLQFHGVTRDDKGNAIFGHHSRYRKDWIAANGGRLPYDPRRLSLSVFKKLLWVEVETVTRDQCASLPSSCHYSKVKRVIRLVEDGEEFAGGPLQVIGSRAKQPALPGEGEGERQRKKECWLGCQRR
jgi:hypothetical protein